MRKVLLFIGLALLTVPHIANADTLHFQGFNALTKGSWITVTQSGSVVTGWAGEIEWTLAGQNFSSYCVDLFDDAVLPDQSGTMTTTGALNASTDWKVQNPAGGAMAAWLANTYGTSLNTAAGLTGYSVADAAAGLQIAIWQALYGLQGSVVQSGVALWDTPGLSDSIQGASSIMYGALMAASATEVSSSSAAYFDVDNGPLQTAPGVRGQDQIGVPEPSALLLLAMAMMGMLTFQYRLKRLAVEI